MNIQEQWVQFHRNKLFTRGTNTNNRIERHNRTLKTNRLQMSDHLVESVKILIRHAYHIHKEALNITIKDTVRVRQINHGIDCLFLREYSKVLTDHAIDLIKTAQSHMDDIIEKYNIEDNSESEHNFIFKCSNRLDIMVSFNHAGQLQCNCKGFMQYQITCSHILIILEHIILKNLEEPVTIEELVDIKRFYLKQNGTFDQNAISYEPEPIITQTIQQTNQSLSSNAKYNQLNAVVQRFVARSTQEGTSNFNKILDIFTSMTEAIEQNNLNEFCLNFQHNFVNDKELSNEEIELVIQTQEREQELEPEPVNPCCSKDIAPKSPFTLVSCKNPIGRPKNSTKSTVTSFTKQVKRKTSQIVHSIKSSKLPKIFNKKTTTTTTTITKTSTSTSITDKHNKNLDDTLADIEELEESCVLDKNCIQISDDSDSSLPSINL